VATVQHGLRLATPGLADRGPVRALLVDGTVVRMRELDEADAQDVALFYRGRSSASRPAGGSDVLRQHLSSDATPGTSGPSGPWRPRPTLPSSRFRRGRVLMSDEQAPALEALSGVECYRLLATAQVGRLGVHAHRYPLIFPSTTHSTGRRSSYERSRVRSSALPTTRMSPSRSTTSIHGRAAGGACSSGESPRRSPLLVPAGRRWASGPVAGPLGAGRTRARWIRIPRTGSAVGGSCRARRRPNPPVDSLRSAVVHHAAGGRGGWYCTAAPRLSAVAVSTAAPTLLAHRSTAGRSR